MLGGQGKAVRLLVKEIDTWCNNDGEFVVDTYTFKLEASVDATYTTAIISVYPPINLPYYGRKYEIKLDYLDEIYLNQTQPHLTLGTHKNNIWYSCNIMDNYNTQYSF